MRRLRNVERKKKGDDGRLLIADYQCLTLNEGANQAQV